ncbi:scavenger receptor cysteine-rich type 1 protein M130 [Channa argus]|uniref:scavenger receptor cysteine-rich type 1 protein M130 n=1 Tax=Channa argus TaxID=215402 RepID=UPI003520C55B
MMRFLLLLVFITHAELVIANDKDILILKNGSNPCEGYIQIYHDNKWGYVGDKFWNMSTEKVVCRSIHCGEPLPGSKEDAMRTIDSTVWLNELKCNGNESQLWNCEHPGWNISYYPKDTVKKIKCSYTIKLSLDGFQCAGAVQYSTNPTEPPGYICTENWRAREANHLCEQLKCGKSKEIPQDEWMTGNKFKTSAKMSFNCSNIENVEKNLWQCVTKVESPQLSCKTPASVICEGHERLQLRQNASNVCSGQLEIEEESKWRPAKDIKTSPDAWCQQMHCGTKLSHTNNTDGIQLKCSDQVKVVLKDNNNNACYGTVHIELNNSTHPVCASSWVGKDGELVCKELNCGRLIRVDKKSITKHGIMDHVNCSGSESSLWHCRAKIDKNLFSCENTAYVVCEDSMKVKLEDGPGKCAGRLEILEEGEWKRVSQTHWIDDNSHAVCKQVGCGQKREAAKGEKFSKGSSNLFTKKVTCKKDASSTSDCDLADSDQPAAKETEVVGITCTEHKMVFLDGENACSGRVGVQQGTNTYWLSGSNETWNQVTANVVCRQMQCGVADNFASIENSDVNNHVVTASLCSNESQSLLDCLKPDAISPDPNGTIASVTCSGKINITLSKECWGAVNISINKSFGGVCADTWTNDQSQMLCKNLGCGEKTFASTNREQIQIKFKSLHFTTQTRKLSQSSFVKCGENDQICKSNPANVICSGSVKPKFNIYRDKCIGNVELFYEGEWLPVCEDALKDVNAQKIICRRLNCGEADKLIDYFGHKPTEYPAISTLECPKADVSLQNCKIVRSAEATCRLAGLQCSKWRKMKLNNTCSGEVLVDSNKGKRAVSSEGWTETEGKRLCQDLGCGSSWIRFHNVSQKKPFWEKIFSCADVKSKTNIWDCENNTQPTQKQQLLIECKDVQVTLSRPCNGIVKINDLEVCSTGWRSEYSHLVCQEQSCSNAIVGIDMTASPQTDKDYYHVRCDFGQHTLGQCERVKQKCAGKLVSVYCVKNVKFKTTEKCGGQIEVNYQDKWEKMCPTDLTSDTKNKLCKNIGCAAHNSSREETKNLRKASSKTTLICGDSSSDIRHCVRAKACENASPAQIYCNGYKPPPIPPPPPPPIPILPIILGLGFFLVLVILIVVFVRICLAKKAKKAMKLSARMVQDKDVEFESGDYEDVKANEMEDFSHGRFRSESETMMDNDGRSISSFHYDDVDEAVEDRPLTSQASTTEASGDKNLQEDTLDQNNATYEVDDPQESYDDIEAGSEITKTEAEVHNSHQTAAAIVPPPDLVPGDDDYLVPDQQGCTVR